MKRVSRAWEEVSAEVGSASSDPGMHWTGQWWERKRLLCITCPDLNLDVPVTEGWIGSLGWTHAHQLSGGLSGKQPSCQCRRHKRHGVNPWVRKIWSRKRPPTPVLLPGKFHGQRSLVGYNPWGCKESDTTEHTAQLYTTICKIDNQWGLTV